jgi:toxin HigB-1
VIQSFKCDETKRLFTTGKSAKFSGMAKVATRKLAQLAAATTLDFLRVPPGNRLEALQGDRAGQHGIRVNGQFRVCFVWTEAGPADVEIVDYH